MSLVWEQVIVDARRPVALGRWWADALSWVIVDGADADDDDTTTDFEIRASADALPGLLFVPVDDVKTVKNRLHLDFRPDDQAAEVARFESLGARRTDVGQSDDVSWVVLTDPEGNEFCILGSRR
ncbi:VOC family protein [Frigoribacterium sp. 2-23]|uniref:VOC family protein n=1 Tax=Frigoribacterium sp. 2-23 TaxID=3415006 RepID=UPI003C6EDA2C